MPKSKIKKEFSTTIVAFGGGGRKPLGQRDDIDKLAIMAHESQNPNLISLFEYLPSLEELKKESVSDVLKKSADAVRAETETVAKTDDK